jgi:hypothetical protein
MIANLLCGVLVGIIRPNHCRRHAGRQGDKRCYKELSHHSLLRIMFLGENGSRGTSNVHAYARHSHIGFGLPIVPEVGNLSILPEVAMVPVEPRRAAHDVRCFRQTSCGVGRGAGGVT